MSEETKNEIRKETRQDVEVVIDQIVKMIEPFILDNQNHIMSKQPEWYEVTMWRILLRGLHFLKSSKDREFKILGSRYNFYHSHYSFRFDVPRGVQPEWYKNEVLIDPATVDWIDLIELYIKIRDFLIESINELNKYEAIKEEKILWKFLFDLYSLFVSYNSEAREIKKDRKDYHKRYRQRFLNL